MKSLIALIIKRTLTDTYLYFSNPNGIIFNFYTIKPK